MKWTEETEKAIAKVPFFVRKRVRKQVEEEAARCGCGKVCLEHVNACQRGFLQKMEDEVKGFQVETCFGSSGCPHRAVVYEDLSKKLEERLSRKNLKAFLKGRVDGPLKIHHEFRVSISDCPDACSRPQIVDLGLIGACSPKVSTEPCSECMAWIEACREGAISLKSQRPIVDEGKCLSCGQCIGVCPTGTLQVGTRGTRILVGGKLGRHPKLARELPGIRSLDETLNVVDRCLDYYQKNCLKGERFGEILERNGMDKKIKFLT